MRIRQILLLSLVLFAAAIPSIAALVPPFFLNCVVAIGYRQLLVVPGKDGKLEAIRGNFIPVASGFLYGHFLRKVNEKQKQYALYLITNHHVWEGVERLEKLQIDQAATRVAIHEIPTMVLQFNPKAPGAPAQRFEAPLHNQDPKWDWVQDPVADLAATPLNATVLDNAGIQYGYFQSDDQIADQTKAKEIELTEGDGVYVLGFPMGLIGGARNFVITRQGAIARVQDWLAGVTDHFLIDAFVFPGNSGGPVVTKPDLTAIEGTKSQNTSYLIGVVRSYIPYQDTAISEQTGRPRITFEENSGLAEVIPMDAVNKLIEAKDKVMLGK